SGVVVLSKASLAALVQVQTDGSLVFNSPPAQVRDLGAGKIVAAGVSSATPEGLLAQVTSVASVGSTVTVATTPASLDQALSTAGFGTTAVLTAGQVAAFTPGKAGIRLAPAASSADCPAPGLSVTVKVPLYKASDGRKITVGGDVCILPRVSFSASISGLRLSSKFTGTVTASASLAFTAELSHDITGGVNLFYVKLNPIAF